MATMKIATTTTPSLLSQFKAARRAAVPLLAVQTTNPAATMATLSNGTKNPVLVWDVAAGVRSATEAGQTLYTAADLTPEDSPVEVLTKLAAKAEADPTAAKKLILYLIHAHRFVNPQGQPILAQAIWNIRDTFKALPATLVLLGPSFDLPAELRGDFVTLDEPLPTDDELAAIILATVPDDIAPFAVADVVDGCRGMTTFQAEQAVAMAVTENGLDLPTIWRTKVATINATPGLTVHKPGLPFSAIGGMARFKAWATRRFTGGFRPGLIVLLDEADKVFAGASGPVGDSSGTSQDALGVFLREMEDNEYTGALALGHPGTGKTFIVTSLAAEFGVQAVTADVGATKDSLVGGSEAKIRAMFKVIKAIAGPGGALFLGTCNSVATIPPALRRRFTDGLWFFDLPTAEEKADIWTATLKRYGVKDGPRPDDTDWTGADIRNTVRNAQRLACSLIEAATYIVPVAKADPKGIAATRQAAAGAFLSVSAPGVYTLPTLTAPSTAAKLTGRAIAGKD